MRHAWTLLAVVLAQPQFAMATPGLGDALSNALPHATSASPAAECASFEGTWKGVCTFGNVKKDDTKVIHQTGCTALQSGDNYEPIGGLSNINLTIPSEKGVVGASVVGATDWNKDKTALDIHFNGLVKKIGEAGVLDVSGTGTQRLDGNRMIVDFKVLGAQGSCVYDKQ